MIYYHISWNNNGANYTQCFSSREELEQFKKRIEGAPNVKNIQIWEVIAE